MPISRGQLAQHAHLCAQRLGARCRGDASTFFALTNDDGVVLMRLALRDGELKACIPLSKKSLTSTDVPSARLERAYHHYG